jgi:hypothetical protein
VLLLSNQPVSATIGAAQAFLADPVLAVGLAFGLVWMPILWGLFTSRGSSS